MLEDCQERENDRDGRRLDLPRGLTWIVLPMIGVVLLKLLVLEGVLGTAAMQSGFYENAEGVSFTWYRVFTFKEGPLEYATALILLPGIVASIYAARNYKRLPAKWLGVWMVICALGMVYYCGEELSWGHHIAVSVFGKEAAPEAMTALGFNEQGETNIHNLDNALGKMLGRNSKNMVEIWCYVAAFGFPLVMMLKKKKLPPSDPGAWFWPTSATMVCAAMVFLVYRPLRLYEKTQNYDVEPYWIRQSELQEFYVACTLAIYACSIAWRLRKMRQAPVAAK